MTVYKANMCPGPPHVRSHGPILRRRSRFDCVIRSCFCPRALLASPICVSEENLCTRLWDTTVNDHISPAAQLSSTSLWLSTIITKVHAAMQSCATTLSLCQGTSRVPSVPGWPPAGWKPKYLDFSCAHDTASNALPLDTVTSLCVLMQDTASHGHPASACLDINIRC